MPIDPRIALSFKMPDMAMPLETAAKAMALKRMGQESQLGDLQIKDMQAAQKDQAIVQKAMQESYGDPEKFLKGMVELGASPATVQKYEETFRKRKTEEISQMKSLVDLQTSQVKNEEAANEQNLRKGEQFVAMLEAVDPFVQQGNLPAAQQAFLQVLERAKQDGVVSDNEINRFRQMMPTFNPETYKQIRSQMSLGLVMARNKLTDKGDTATVGRYLVDKKTGKVIFEAPEDKKEPTQGEIKDQRLKAFAAELFKKDPKDLTDLDMAKADIEYQKQVAAGKAESYPGQEFAVTNADGTIAGFVNRQTMAFRPLTGGAEGKYGGGTPNINETTAEQLAGMKTSIDLIKVLEPKLKGVHGPVLGRVKLAEVSKLGGLGATKDEIELAQNLYRLVTSQAFANGGKQLTPTELERFERMTPQLSDTVDQAAIKAKESISYLRLAMKNRINSLTPRTRAIIEKSIVDEAAQSETAQPAQSGVRIRDPKTGKTGTYKGTKEEAIKAGYEVI